jgi:hypothetical protein
VGLLGIAIPLAKNLGELSEYPIVIAVILGAMLVLLWGPVTALIDVYRSEPLPEPLGEFSPFPKPDWRPWDRNRVTTELASLVEATTTQHVLLVSPSGTGKSTMINQLLPKKLEQYQVIRISNYTNVVRTLLVDLTGSLNDNSVKDEVFQFVEGKDTARVDELEACLLRILSAVRNSGKILICFDQVERYFIRHDSAAEKNYAELSRENAVVRLLLKHLAGCENIRTVFAVRSEYIFGSLSNLFNFNTNGSGIEKYVEFYFLWGVNDRDDRDIYLDLSKKLQNKFGGRLKTLFGIALIQNPMKANTFLLNMGGYLYEQLRERKKYKGRLSEPNLSGDDLIDIYLDAAFEGYVAKSGRNDRCLFDTVIYALASDTKTSGQAADGPRIAGLAHFPEEEVQSVVFYLQSTGVIETERSEGEDTYRLKHEKLSDRVLKSDKLIIHSCAIDGIRYLTANGVETKKLTVPRHFPTSLETSLTGFANVGYIAVLIYALFGIARLAFPESTYALINLTKAYDLLFRLSGYQFHDYYMTPQFYAPHFIANVAWVSYIDRMNRSYVQNVTRGIPAFLGNCLALLGTTLGIWMAFVPELFVVPTVTVGVVFAFILMTASRSRNFNGQIKEMTRAWGLRTFLNVSVVFLLNWKFFAPNFDMSDHAMGILTNIPPGERVTYLLILVIAEAVLMLWFWQHIKADQNTRKIWSANLSLYDKGSIFGR